MCKVSYKIIKLIYTSFIIAVVTLACFLVIPSGSASAAAYEYNYIYEYYYITDVFPQGFSNGYNNKYPNQVRFFESDQYSWGTGKSYTVTYENITYNNSPSFSYISCKGDNSQFKAKSATVRLNSCVNDLIPGKFYVIDFTLKFDYDDRIVTATNIQNLNLEHRFFDSSDTAFKTSPVEVWTSGAHSYAHFNYTIDGKWMNGFSEFMFYFKSSSACWQDCRIWFDPKMPFTVREQTSSEAEADLIVDKLTGITDSRNPDNKYKDNAQNLANGFNEVEKDFKIDSDQASELLADSDAIFEDEGFTDAFGFINAQINRYTSSSAVMYAFYVTILGLGLAFSALGRSL